MCNTITVREHNIQMDRTSGFTLFKLSDTFSSIALTFIFVKI